MQLFMCTHIMYVHMHVYMYVCMIMCLCFSECFLLKSCLYQVTKVAVAFGCLHMFDCDYSQLSLDTKMLVYWAILLTYVLITIMAL